MWSEYTQALALGALACAGLCVGAARPLGWLAAIVASFVITAIYGQTHLPWAPMVNLFADALLCAAIYWRAAYRWESLLFVLCQGSCWISLFRFLGVVESHNHYVATLEVINWAILALLACVRLLGMVGHVVPAGSGWRMYLHWAVSAVCAPRKAAPWWCTWGAP